MELVYAEGVLDDCEKSDLKADENVKKYTFLDLNKTNIPRVLFSASHDMIRNLI
jgi:hypothetical protein